MTDLQTLKGFRDFLPEEKRKRDYVEAKIKEIFELYGFAPLQTPTLEYASVLMGKYGDEADKLIYNFQDRGGRQVALPYDQTVPTARILAQYKDQLPKYFRRYKISNVFRAEKPQKGRYREFTQCDIDIFGSTSSLADAELLACSYFAYKNIGFPEVKIIINDRQTLINTLTPFATEGLSVFSIIQTIDKLDKQTEEQVTKELVNKGMEETQAQTALKEIKQAPISTQVQEIVRLAVSLGVPSESLQYTSTLSRGLDYYTGMIFEVIIPNATSGSCGGGGRYDNLIGNLSGQSIPAVGMAVGFDRTVEVAESLGIIPQKGLGATVLVTCIDTNCEDYTLQIAHILREQKIRTELFVAPEDNIGKRFKYASKNNFPYILVVGEQEQQTQTVTLKNLQTGDQSNISLEKSKEILENSQNNNS